MRGIFGGTLSVAVALWGAVAAPAQSMNSKDLGVGKLLVAPRNAPDPNFAKTVILLVHYDDAGVLGLAINRRTDLPISHALHDLKDALKWPEPVFAGGPVEATGILALLRSHTPSEGATQIFGDVYLVSTKPVLQKILNAGTSHGDLRVYLGYCGWTARQLQNEMMLKAWYVFDADAALIFNSNPDSVWPRLIGRTEQRMARNR